MVSRQGGKDDTCFESKYVKRKGMNDERKLPVTWGWAVVFAGSSGFLHQVQLASHDVAVKW